MLAALDTGAQARLVTVGRRRDHDGTAGIVNVPLESDVALIGRIVNEDLQPELARVRGVALSNGPVTDNANLHRMTSRVSDFRSAVVASWSVLKKRRAT